MPTSVLSAAAVLAFTCLSACGGRSSLVIPVPAPDTSRWSLVAKLGNPDYLAIWGSGPSDIFVVGAHGLVAHYDGRTWTLHPVSAQRLTSIWGTGPNNVYAVGASGVILRYDGSTWTQLVSGTSATLNAIVGTSPTTIYAGGSDGALLSYNGVSWQPVKLNQTNSINGLSASGAHVFAATGGDDTQPDPVLHFDGATWVVELTPATRGLSGVWSAETTGAIVVGPDGVFRRNEHGQWLKTGCAVPSNGLLLAVWGPATDDAYVCGQAGQDQGPSLAMHFNGTACTAISPTGVDSLLTGIWGDGSGLLYFIGTNGTILKYAR